MAKLTADLFGVPDGEVWPRVLPAGSDCPPELMEAARALGALGDAPAARMKRAPRNKAATPPENK